MNSGIGILRELADTLEEESKQVMEMEAELARLRAVNAELVEALTEALELMPLGTEKRAKWLLKAGDIILSPGQTDFETRYQNRGHLMDAYVTALAEIADGRENPIEYARVVLRQGSKTLIESAKALSRAEQAEPEVKK